jgi:hypothetical protein
MMFLPFQGTFLRNRGVVAGSFLIRRCWGVAGSPARSLRLGVEGVGTSCSGTSWLFPLWWLCRLAVSWPLLSASRVDIVLSGPANLARSACLRVSRLDRVRGCLDDLRGGNCGWAARGVFRSASPSQRSSSPTSEPLSEEFSLLSVPSLSQSCLSEPKPPVVCWRIQSSVRPRAGRRARFASTAALSSDGCAGVGGAPGKVGAGLRNGVAISK